MAARAITDQTTGEITIVDAYDRTVDGSEGSSFTFTSSASLYLEGVILLISGGAVTASFTATNAAGTTMVLNKPGSPVAGDTLLVVVLAYDNAGMSWTPPAGWSSATTAYDTHASSVVTGTSSSSLPDVTTSSSAGILVGLHNGYNFDASTTPSGWSAVTNWDVVNRVWSKAYSSSGSQGGPWSFSLAGSSTSVASVFAYSSGGSSVTGTIAATLDAPTSAMSGTVTRTGTIAATLAIVAMSAVGFASNPYATPPGNIAMEGGSGALLLEGGGGHLALEQDAGGSITGTITSTVPVATSAISAAHGVSGTIASTTPVATSAITAAHGVSGTIASTTPVATSAISATHSIAGTIAATLDAPTAAIVGSFGSDVTGTIAASVPVATSAISATHSIAGTIGATAPVATSAITAAHGVSGTITATVDIPTSAITGVVVRAGTIAATTPVATSTISATHSIVGTIGATVPAVTMVAAGTADGPIGALPPLVPPFAATLTGPRTLTVSTTATTVTTVSAARTTTGDDTAQTATTSTTPTTRSTMP